MTTLYVRDGDTFHPATAYAVLERATDLVVRKFRRGSPTTNPNNVRDYVRFKLGSLDHEVFAVLMLDTHLRLIEYVELFRGTVDGASVYPREVVKEAIARGAHSVILVHNHPSGCA